ESALAHGRVCGRSGRRAAAGCALVFASVPAVFTGRPSFSVSGSGHTRGVGPLSGIARWRGAETAGRGGLVRRIAAAGLDHLSAANLTDGRAVGFEARHIDRRSGEACRPYGHSAPNRSKRFFGVDRWPRGLPGWWHGSGPI